MKNDNAFKDLSKFIDNYESAVESTIGEHDFYELFPDDYVQSVSKFQSIQELLERSPENITNQKELEEADESILDKFISENTKFQTWDDFLGDAETTFVDKSLKLRGF